MLAPIAGVAALAGVAIAALIPAGAPPTVLERAYSAVSEDAIYHDVATSRELEGTQRRPVADTRSAREGWIDPTTGEIHEVLAGGDEWATDGRRRTLPAGARRGDGAARAPAHSARPRPPAGPRVALFDPLLHNTASATIVRGGQSANVIPGEVSVDLDCRLLPGFGPDDVFGELRALAGVDLELDVLRPDPGPPSPDMALFPTLGAILRDLDPSAHPMPLLLPAVSDARFFARLGIQTYGFLPMQLPQKMRFMELVHAEDERIPVESLEFGTGAIRRLLERFGATERPAPPAGQAASG